MIKKKDLDENSKSNCEKEYIYVSYICLIGMRFIMYSEKSKEKKEYVENHVRFGALEFWDKEDEKVIKC